MAAAANHNLILRPLDTISALFSHAAGTDVDRLGDADFGAAEHFERALLQDGLLSAVRVCKVPPQLYATTSRSSNAVMARSPYQFA